jgi:hypothetical protein
MQVLLLGVTEALSECEREKHKDGHDYEADDPLIHCSSDGSDWGEH